MKGWLEYAGYIGAQEDRRSPPRPHFQNSPYIYSMSSSNQKVPYSYGYSGSRPPPSSPFDGTRRHVSERGRRNYGDSMPTQRSPDRVTPSASPRLPAYAPDSVSSRREYERLFRSPEPSASSQRDSAKTVRTSTFSFLPAPKGMQVHDVLDVTLDILDDETRKERRSLEARKDALTAQWAADASPETLLQSHQSTRGSRRRT